MNRLLYFFALSFPLLTSAQGDWLIRYTSGADRSEPDALFQESYPTPLYPGSEWQRLHFDHSPDAEMITRLQEHPAISAIEREVPYSSQTTPNDPGLSEQWALHNTGQAGGPQGVDIRALDAWRFTTGSDNVTIAVIDAGIDWRHPDLVDNIWQNLAEDADGDGSVLVWNGNNWEFDPDDLNGIDDDGNGYADDFIGWDFVNDDNDPSDDHQFGHGTHVAGILAARGNNGIGITGVSWRSQIMALKFLDTNGSGFTGDAIEAIRYARQMGADLSNNSWGGGLFSQALRDELMLAQQDGMICVAAAGNNFGNDNDEAPLYPASYSLDNVISVSASDPVDSLAPFANKGLNSVDLCAPGYGIYSTLPDGQYGFLNGTSMAAPFVTGALALLKIQRPGLGIHQLRQQLIRSVQPQPGLRGTCVTEGRLDLLSLLQQPLLFQRSLPGNVRTGAALSNGSLIASGDHQDSLWVASLQPDGQLAWSFRYQPGSWYASAASANGGVWLGGQSNGEALLTHLDNMGQVSVTRTLIWGSPLGITHMTNDLAGIWVTGWSLSGSDTAIWIVQLTNNGQITQQRRYAATGNDLCPVALHLNEEGELGLLAQLNGEELAWLLLDDQGILIQADQLDLPGVSTVLGHGLWGENDKWTISGHLILPDGDRQLFVLNWEEEEGYDETIIWPLGQTNEPSVNGAGRAGSQWISSGATGSSGQGMRLLHLDEDGEEVLRRSYEWPGESVTPAWIGQAQPGLVSWLLNRPGNGSYWGQTDEKGNSLCFTDSTSISSLTGSFPIQSNLLLSSPGGSASLSPASLSGLAFTEASSLLCDNSQCTVEAFFSLPSLEICEDGDLIPDNLSQNASSFEWRISGELIDTASAPLFQAPDIDGDYELTLVAFQGQCVDSFRLPLFVEPPLEIFNIDTTHCGQRLTLRAPRASGYTWRDENGDIVGTEESFTFTQSGSYELELTNSCGDISGVDYEVLLQGDCVWPGDVSADGQVDMVDYLLLGMVHGQSGPPRTNASPTYSPQPSPIWPTSFQADNPWAPGVNLAHADANGDGIIDAETDGALVRLHANTGGLPRVAPDPTASVNISLQLDTTVVQSGDSVEFEVSLTSANGLPIADAYALALTIESSVPLSQPMELTPEGNWITAGGAEDTLLFREANSRRVQVGLVRLDQSAATAGAGRVMKGIIIVIVDDIGTYATLSGRGFLSLAVSEALLIRPDGSRIPLNPLGAQATRTIQVLPDSSGSVGITPPFEQTWRAFPNPTDGHLQVQGQLSPGHDRTWQIANLYGQIISTGTWPGHDDEFEVDLRAFPAGYYILQVEEQGDIHHAKIWLRK